MSINATLIGQMITFTLLVWFTMKYVWPPIIAALEERKIKIAEGLRKEVSSLALRAAEQILKEEIDKAKHQDLLNRTAEKLG